MPLDQTQVELLEVNRSHYGCGSSHCLRCYPVQYRCDYCGDEYPQPIANGETYTCEGCGYTEGEEQ